MFAMRLLCLCTLVALLASPERAGAESYVSMQERRPDLFDTETGYRIARQRAPTPQDIPAPVTRIMIDEVVALQGQGALLLDVFGAQSARYDELDGTWLVSKVHESLPGALWLPEVGRGRLTEEMQAYLARNLEAHLSDGRGVIVFCVADCWMSWNAAQRIAAMGYGAVYWFREGISGWLDAGWTLEPAEPVPVGVE
ncbi:rhodanese-like domain-containing protein [Primorskyibacter sp. S187A]|uniref:rhodanese-like domain-containing protein n=1 Tax=Primorskyibacter sp. S187A TaxID=3415130 RepID=UPI003C7ED933